MSLLEFVSSLVSAIVWPFVLLIILIVYRKTLMQALMARSVEEFALGPNGVRIKYFDKTLDEVEEKVAISNQVPKGLPSAKSEDAEVSVLRDKSIDEILRVIEVSPSAGVVLSFGRLENELREALKWKQDIDSSLTGHRPVSKMGIREMTSFAVKCDLLPPAEAEAIGDLAELRNAVAHGGSAAVPLDRALSYASVVRQLIISLRLAQGRTIADGPF